MKMPQEQVERIKELGYTEAEARFLYIVAVHSGYFTLGQFRAFTKTAYGKRPTSFAQKLINRGHATVRDYMRRGSIFHLFSRTLYGQIDKDNLRNRKRHSFDFMRGRLVLLDFILANQDLNYFETEQDKVRFFCDEMGIPKDALPAKVYEGGLDGKPTLRYFVDKFPMFLASPFSGAPPVATLSYVDSGFETSSHFVAHLATYHTLFRELKTFRFLYIASKDAYFQKAQERHEYVVPITEDLEFLKEARQRFQGEQFDGVFEAWKTGKVTEQEVGLEFSREKPEQAVFFSTFLVRLHGSPVDEVTRRGDGCMKDTHHRYRHRSRHPRGDAKLLGA
jgi:hypothetical protein